jgi:hypothetical protein
MTAMPDTRDFPPVATLAQPEAQGRVRLVDAARHYLRELEAIAREQDAELQVG